MSELTTEQLEAIRRLLIDPLKETVRQEMRLTYQRLHSTTARLEDRAVEHERRLIVVERSTAQLKTFRRRVVAIYGLVALVIGAAWSLLREKVLSRLMGP